MISISNNSVNSAAAQTLKPGREQTGNRSGSREFGSLIDDLSRPGRQMTVMRSESDVGKPAGDFAAARRGHLLGPEPHAGEAEQAVQSSVCHLSPHDAAQIPAICSPVNLDHAKIALVAPTVYCERGSGKDKSSEIDAPLGDLVPLAPFNSKGLVAFNQFAFGTLSSSKPLDVLGKLDVSEANVADAARPLHGGDLGVRVLRARSYLGPLPGVNGIPAAWDIQNHAIQRIHAVDKVDTLGSDEVSNGDLNREDNLALNLAAAASSEAYPAIPESSLNNPAPNPDLSTAGVPIPVNQLPKLLEAAANKLVEVSRNRNFNGKVGILATQRVQELNLELAPPGLGSVNVSMRLRGDGLSITLVASNDAVLEAMRNARAAIVDRIGAGGKPLEALVLRKEDASHTGGEADNASNRGEVPRRNGQSDSAPRGSRMANTAVRSSVAKSTLGRGSRLDGVYV